VDAELKALPHTKASAEMAAKRKNPMVGSVATLKINEKEEVRVPDKSIRSNM
jgi:hypothetical protein